ncbi:MAG TPA: hypothetical protein VM328_04725 [Fimbriimonadaceae bacterium]|nr:hypothetical protein [Fimbriimonadaceae bacterium]
MQSISAAREVLPPAGAYRLEDVLLQVAEEELVFSCRLAGPSGSAVWARAWLSDAEGTLTETASPPQKAGALVRIVVPIPSCLPSREYIAVIRSESSPLRTEHVVTFQLWHGGSK